MAVSVSQADHSQVTDLFTQFTRSRYEAQPAWWSNPKHPGGQVGLTDHEHGQGISRLFENGHESIDIAHRHLDTSQSTTQALQEPLGRPSRQPSALQASVRCGPKPRRQFCGLPFAAREPELSDRNVNRFDDPWRGRRRAAHDRCHNTGDQRPEIVRCFANYSQFRIQGRRVRGLQRAAGDLQVQSMYVGAGKSQKPSVWIHVF